MEPSTEFQNPLEIIGLTPTRLRELGPFRGHTFALAAAKQLLAQLHPDNIRGEDAAAQEAKLRAEEKYKDVQEARSKLEDNQKFRRWYDVYTRNPSQRSTPDLSVGERQATGQTQLLQCLLDTQLFERGKGARIGGAQDLNVLGPQRNQMSFLVLPVPASFVSIHLQLGTSAEQTERKPPEQSSAPRPKSPALRNLKEPGLRALIMNEKGDLIEGKLSGEGALETSTTTRSPIGFLSIRDIERRYLTSDAFLHLNSGNHMALACLLSDAGLGDFLDLETKKGGDSQGQWGRFRLSQSLTSIPLDKFARMAEFLRSRPSTDGPASSGDVLCSQYFFGGKPCFALEGFVTDAWIGRTQVLRTPAGQRHASGVSF